MMDGDAKKIVKMRWKQLSGTFRITTNVGCCVRRHVKRMKRESNEHVKLGACLLVLVGLVLPFKALSAKAKGSNPIWVATLGDGEGIYSLRMTYLEMNAKHMG